jgi:hypothetical protein
MIQRFAFTAGFYFALPAPKGLFHQKTPFAMNRFFSFADVAAYSAA